METDTENKREYLLRIRRNAKYALSPQDIQRMVEATVDFQEKLIIKTFWWLGLRTSELVMLNVEDVDFVARQVTVRSLQYGHLRHIPIIDDQYLLELKTFIGYREKGAVFSPRGEKESYTRTTKIKNIRGRKTPAGKGGAVAITDIVRKAGKRAEIEHPNPTAPNINATLLRHSVAHWLVSAGYSLEFVQHFLGFRKPKNLRQTYNFK